MRDEMPPYDLDSEEAVIGSILIDSDAFGQIGTGTEDFFSEQNQFVFGAMRNLYKRSEVINQITVAHELNNLGKLDDAGGAAYLSHLVSMVPTSLHIAGYAKIVEKCAFNRRLISAAGQLESIGYKNMAPEESMAKSLKLLKGLGVSIRDDSVLDPGQIASEAQLRYMALDQPKPYIKTGIENFDAKKGGLLPETVVIAGRTTVGKTTFGLQIARNISFEKYVLFISLEMSKAQVTNKNIAALTGISEKRISLGHYDRDKEGPKISDAIAKLSRLQLYVAEGNRNVDSIRRIVEHQILTVGCDLVIIDYIQRIQGGEGKSRYERVGSNSSEICTMQKEFNIPVISLAQLNREIEHRDGGEPKLIDLRDSGNIEEDADLVIILAPVPKPSSQFQLIDTEYDPHAAFAYVLKDRLRGDTGKIPLHWKDGVYL